jgi:hypothetical protein
MTDESAGREPAANARGSMAILARCARGLLLCGCLAVLVGLVLLIQAILFARRARPIDAVVVEVSTNWDQDHHSTRYSPTIRYTASDESTHTVKMGSDGGFYSVGMTIPILYNAADPESVSFPGFSGVYGPSVIFLAIASGTVLLSFGASRAAMKAKGQSSEG